MVSTIRGKVYLTLGIIALALIFQAAYLLAQTERIRAQMTYLAVTNKNIMSELHSMQVATIQIQQWLTDISATRAMDGLDDGFEEAENSAQQFREAVAQLITLDKSSGIDYQALIPVMENFHETGKKMANAYIAGGAASGNLVMAEFDETAKAIYDNIEKISDQLTRNQNEEFSSGIEITKHTEVILIIFSIFYALLIAFMLFGVNKFVLKPIHKILAMTQNLTNGDGDLTQRLNITGYNELSQLAGSFNKFIDHTDKMVSNVTKSVVRLIPMAKELADTNVQIEQASVDQSKLSHKVAVSVDQTKESAEIVSNHIYEIVNSVKDNVVALTEGQNMALETINSMGQLSKEIGVVSEAIMQLRNDSGKIESIIDVINSISEQTNLLALNAAIEAARAGEAGRGFAVVADEVRTLATRTKNSTEEVQSMINSIQNGTLQAAKMMEKGMASTQHSVDQVNKSETMLRKVAASMTEIESQTSKINNETKTQNNHFKTVSESIDKMEEQFATTLEHLEHNLAFGQDLDKLSEKLRKLIGQFKVTDNDWSDAKRSKKRPTKDNLKNRLRAS